MIYKCEQIFFMCYWTNTEKGREKHINGADDSYW